jgi:hypothetical protein
MIQMKFLWDVLQIAIAIRILYGLGKWLLRKKKRKSMSSKVWRLISNRVHHRLDIAIKKQRDALYPKASRDGKVVPLRKTH